MPAKMFNSNVTCDILLGFVKATFAKDVDEVCRQRSIKIAIDIEGIKKEREMMRYGMNESLDRTAEELEELLVKYEAQAENLAGISKTVKEIQSAVIDLTDTQGNRIKLNEHLRDRGVDVIKPRLIYELVRVESDIHVPLKFTM
ncbi:hypothetical protein THRCLA_20284 [Thraustotheca clavata]|uniref:Uncharacterized protein n=1 Tax=Thraustotheca clavata TaxID=74557 RepID=A0A1W0A994_9STRA|nr:hypothetical protein THRCLA_20284 [Thraustotheca clavata]